MAKFCSNCGNEILENDRFCTNCGTTINSEITNNNDNNQIQDNGVAVVNNNPNNFNNTNNVVKYTNSLGIAGFVISLVSMVCCCGGLSWLSLIFSIIGLVNSKKNNGEGKGLSIAGIILSIIMLVVLVCYVIIFGIAIVAETEI